MVDITSNHSNPMNYSIFKSRTFWTIVVMFLTGGVNAIVEFIPSEIQAVVMAGLAALASYFHVNPSQRYNQ